MLSTLGMALSDRLEARLVKIARLCQTYLVLEALPMNSFPAARPKVSLTFKLSIPNAIGRH
jgi:hypothetical protein